MARPHRGAATAVPKTGTWRRISDLMPDVSDLVDAIEKFEGKRQPRRQRAFAFLFALLMMRTKPEDYGDLVTRPEPFRTLQLKKQTSLLVWPSKVFADRLAEGSELSVAGRGW